MNLLFENQKVNEEFNKLCDSHLLLVISDIRKYYHNAMVTKVYFEDYNLNIVIIFDGEEVTFSSNFKNMETYVSSDNWEYVKVYDNHPQKNFGPKAYLYQKNNKLLIKKNTKNNDSKENNQYFYIFNINKKSFIINIESLDNNFNEELFIKSILNDHINDINNINDVYLLLINSNDLMDTKITIIDNQIDDKIIVYRGILLSYHLTVDEGNVINEIFLQDNKFYKKETIIKELEQDNIYVKKIGGRHGKRKEN